MERALIPDLISATLSDLSKLDIRGIDDIRVYYIHFDTVHDLVKALQVKLCQNVSKLCYCAWPRQGGGRATAGIRAKRREWTMGPDCVFSASVSIVMSRLCVRLLPMVILCLKYVYSMSIACL